ncbi:PRC-barrel domain-containing protein [Thalassobaculum sp.]|uniref:PRC-barrel domain-containing protein n=1 Tax=Thalassobaculum sp. TaxID=2022740 RepID=UPI0032EE2FAE
MPGRSGCAALALGTALLAALGTAPAFADPPDQTAKTCMDEAARFQNALASIPLPPDEREEIERTLVHAHEEAKGGNATACHNALGRAQHFVEEAGGRPVVADAPVPAASAASAPATVAPAMRPPAPSGPVSPELAQLLVQAGLTEAEGATVANADGETVGAVDRVARSRDGRRTFLVVGIGGFLGIGERDVALPLEAFRPGVKQLNLAGYDRPALEGLPAYDPADALAVVPPAAGNAPPD